MSASVFFYCIKFLFLYKCRIFNFISQLLIMCSKDSINLCTDSDESSWQYKDMSENIHSIECPQKPPRLISPIKSSPKSDRNCDDLVTPNRCDNEYEEEDEQQWQRVPVSRKRITLDRNQRKLQKILFDLELISFVNFRSLGMFAVDINIATSEQWLDYLDSLTDLKRDDKWATANIERSPLFKVYSISIRNLICSLTRDQLSHMRYFFMCLKQAQDELKINKNTTTTSTIIEKYGENDNLESLYARKIPQRKQLSFRSWSTLKFDKKSVTFSNKIAEFNSNYLIDMKLFDLNKISQENVGTSNMWKDAIIRMKFYGNTNLDSEPYNIARSLVSRSINIIEGRENEQDNILPQQQQQQVQQQYYQQQAQQHQQKTGQTQQNFQMFYPPPQKKKSKKSNKKTSLV